MKKLTLLSALIILTTQLFSQSNYNETTYPNDPLNMHRYTLANGLTVMISVNKSEPRIQTMIAVRAGSKNDPADHTGLAHYLEHMLFKGTPDYGTTDYASEKIYLQQIVDLYEVYNHTTDTLKRKIIYHQIDSVSGIAATYAIANEYDKMMSSIGAKGTNASTSFDQTVYVNDIPSNQLHKWLEIETDRFSFPVFRLFHTELEAVYEEKNRGLDIDSRKVFEAMMASLFENHTYGTQTTIGTIEHLKNPSLTAIRNFYNTYYVPNNMAIVLSGDLDPKQTIEWINEMWGGFVSKPVPVYNFLPEVSDGNPQVKNVFGPTPEYLQLGYRFPSAQSAESDLVEIIDNIFSNSAAGLIDLSLVKKQLVQSAGSSYYLLHDYGVEFFTVTPKQGQSLDECLGLLLAQIDSVKHGNFSPSLITAIIANMMYSQTSQYETNSGRAQQMVNVFINELDYNNVLNKFNNMKKYTVQDVISFANKYFTNDYAIIYKHTGIDSSVVKVPKPPITPVVVNRDAISSFAKKIMTEPVVPIQPVFLDFDKDIIKSELNKSIPVYSVLNTENNHFELYYIFDMGNNNDKLLPFAVRYLQYLGTNSKSPSEVAQSFYALACTYRVSTTNDEVYVTLNGPNENFESALSMFEDLLLHCQSDSSSFANFISSELKQRNDAKKSKGAILSRLSDYLIYGENNPSNNQISNEEVKRMKADDLINWLHQLTSYNHSIYYYGPLSEKKLLFALKTLHHTPANLLAPPVGQSFHPLQEDSTQVFVVNYPMVQSEIFWKRNAAVFDNNLIPQQKVFNEYFGGGMSSLVFQTIRESKALAYSTYNTTTTPSKKEDPFLVTGYVGCQADKMTDAINAMDNLMEQMPETDQSFINAKNAVISSLQADRVLRASKLFYYRNAMKLGQTTDQRQINYNVVPTLEYSNINTFYNQMLKDKAFNIGILGNYDKLNWTTINSLGATHQISLDQLFGY